MASTTPTSNLSAEPQATVLPATSTTFLAPTSVISIPTSSSSSTTQTTQSQKKKTPWGPILNLLFVLLAILLLIVSIVQTWSYIHTLFSAAQDISSLSIGSVTTAINNSSVGGDPGLTSNGHINEESGGAVKDSHAVVVTSRPLAVREVHTTTPRSPPALHDPSIPTQPKAKQPFTPPPPPQPHIAPGLHAEQKQQHSSPPPEGPKSASKKLEGIAYIAPSHDRLGHTHPHDQTSTPDTDKNSKEASTPASQPTVIPTICAVIGGLVGCFCCVLGSFRLAGCCYYRRRGVVTSKGGVVRVAGKWIGHPRPVSSASFDNSSLASLVSPSPSFCLELYQHTPQHPQQQHNQQPQQQVQMTEFWNIEPFSKDSKRSPTSNSPPSSSSSPSKGGFFKTLRRPSFANSSNNNKNYNKNDALPSRLPLAVTSPTAQVISSPVDFIPPQHSLDSPSSVSFPTLPVLGRGLYSCNPPNVGGGWNNLDFDPLLSPNPSSSISTTGSSTGTKSRRMPALPLPLFLSLKHNSSSQHASSSGLISPCTTMTPLTARSSSNYSRSSSISSSEISHFPWSKSAPYLNNNDNNNCNADIGSRTVRAQKL